MLFCTALLLWAEVANGEQPLYFYTLGLIEGKSNQRVVYKSVVSRLHSETKRTLASVELPKADRLTDLALSADGRLLFGTDAEEVFIFDADQLSLRDHFRVSSKDFPWGGALFAHPKSGLLYLARIGGSNPKEVAIVNLHSRKVINVLKLQTTITDAFVYDPMRDRLYVTAANPAIIDPQNKRVIGYIELPAHATVLQLLRIPGERRLLLRADVYERDRGSGPVLYVYDLDQATLIRRTTFFQQRTLRDLAFSRDGARLFAATSPGGEPGTAVVIDAQTLTILHTLTFPEPIGSFISAPDGRGMWLTTKNGVLRLDDQTGQIIEQVSLPFRLSKLITPP